MTEDGTALENLLRRNRMLSAAINATFSAERLVALAALQLPPYVLLHILNWEADLRAEPDLFYDAHQRLEARQNHRHVDKIRRLLAVQKSINNVLAMR